MILKAKWRTEYDMPIDVDIIQITQFEHEGTWAVFIRRDGKTPTLDHSPIVQFSHVRIPEVG